MGAERLWWWLPWVMLLPLAAMLSLLAGSSHLPPSAVWAALWGEGDPVHQTIVWHARLPVLLLGAAVGASLGASGAALQGVLRNPLADPFLLGVSGGAGLGATIGAMAMGGTALSMTLGAATGALVLMGGLALLALRLPTRGQQASTTLLLAGVMLNALCGALILIAYVFLRPERLQNLLTWLMGSLTHQVVPVSTSGALLLATAAGVLVLHRLSPHLNLLALGDDTATSLGVRVDHYRGSVLAVVALLVAGAVAYAGLIGFVGLLMPHLIRRVAGADYRRVVLGSALAGASLLLLADAVARHAFPWVGNLLPVGAITALVGAPAFLLLLWRQLRSASLGGSA